MTLPEDFNAWEHLQDVWRRVHNRRVREHFRDLADPDSAWSPEIDTPRGALRIACEMADGDTADMTTIRTLLFWVVLGEAAALQTPIYGIPAPSYQEARKFRPQIQLYFQEDYNDVAEGYSPVTGEVSFRLMNETSETLTQSEVTQYATRVRSAFATGSGYIWKKGKVLCSYTDRARGYQFQLLCRSKAEGKSLIEQALDVQQHTPDWKYLNTSENEEVMTRFPTVPPSEVILGRSRRLPRARPIADVRFQFAVLHLWGLPNPIVLIDRSGTRRGAVIESA